MSEINFIMAMAEQVLRETEDVKSSQYAPELEHEVISSMEVNVDR